MEMQDFIRKVLLDNALKYEGKTQANAAVGAVMREFPEMREKKDEVLSLANQVADEVNNLSLDEQKEALEHVGGSGAPVKEEKDVFNIEHPNPVLRFEPSPSGPMHIGHAFPLGLNHLLALRNDGKLILRIADTNPENIYDKAYQLLEDDAMWYTNNCIDQMAVQSDRMELYYEYAEKMLTNGWAYVCTCDPEEFRKLINNKEACPCREEPPAVQLERWALMLTDYEPGDAVVRIKTDVTDKNPAMRDWPALRINTSSHPRQGNRYRVWPLMNFSVVVDDMEMGMTDVLRAKDHADNAKRQEFVHKLFGKTPPTVYFVGKINFTDLKLSSSETRKLIQEGKFTGWDDIRLPFLPALRRRGFQAEAFLRSAEEMGISQTDKTVSQEDYFVNLEAFNKELIDDKTDRAFFVANPTQISIEGAPTVEIEKDLHPTHRKGGRTFVVGSEVLIDPKDLEDADGTLIRLMDAYNFRKEGEKWVFVSKELDDYQKADKKRIIHYLPADADLINAEVHMPDGSIIQGKAESSIAAYTLGDLVQFERFGFVRLDDAKKFSFWFTHA